MLYKLLALFILHFGLPALQWSTHATVCINVTFPFWQLEEKKERLESDREQRAARLQAVTEQIAECQIQNEEVCGGRAGDWRVLSVELKLFYHLLIF